MPDDSWGNIKNLGPVINTKYDDDAPFIHPDRRTMYYSSKGHNSMGGYDIFYTYLNDDGWDEPINIGYPINTIDDDRYYVLSADAKTGYYSTAGRSENGTHDVYTVSPGHFGKRPILALVVGVVNKDNKPVEADITVTNAATGNLEGKFKSNSSSGKYMLALTPGNKYKIAIEVEGEDTKIDYIDVQSLETYVQVEHDFNFGSNQAVTDIANSNENALQGKIDNQIDKYRKESTKEGYEEMVYKKILKEEGEIQLDGIEYFVEAPVGKENKLTEVPTKQVSYPDGTTKTMVGPYKSLLAAEIARQQLIKSDPTLEPLTVKINDNGQEKTVKQYYSKNYSRTDFLKDVTIHDQLTGVEKVDNTEVTKNTATDLVKNEDVNLEKSKNLEDAGGKNIAGLTFKVEVGAVTDTNDFKLGYLEKYGKITAKTYPDGITRYTFGPFETLEQAESFRQMVTSKEKAAEDAFVTVFVFGQRKKLTELNDRQKEELGIIEPKAVAQTGPCNEAFIDFSFFVGKDLNDKTIYNKLIATGGKSCAAGLEFRVQIAAYRFPKNYKWNHLKKYGEPVVKDYPDAITRFTQGVYTTIAEAEVLRQKIIKSGQKDAWITPFYNGKRMLMEELIQNNFFGKTIN